MERFRFMADIAAELAEGWQIGDLWIGGTQQGDTLTTGSPPFPRDSAGAIIRVGLSALILLLAGTGMHLRLWCRELAMTEHGNSM